MKNQAFKIVNSYLSRYVDGELAPDEKRVVDQHLHANAKLRKTVDALRDISSVLKESFSEMETMNTATLRLQQFVSTLPQTAKVKPENKFMKTVRQWFVVPVRLKYAGMMASFLILTLLIVPSVILPHLQSLHPNVSYDKGGAQYGYGGYAVRYSQTEEKRGEQIGAGVQERRGRVSRGIAAGKYVVGDTVERFGNPLASLPVIGNLFDDDGDGIQEEGISLGRKYGIQKGVSKGTEIQGGAVIAQAGEKYVQTGQDAAVATDKNVNKDDRVNDEAFAPDTRKVIRNGNMVVEVEILSDAQAAVERAVAESGSLTAKVHLREKEKPPWAQYTLWIPAERLDDVLEEFKKLGEVQHLEIGIQDITEQYFDQETRIKNLQRQEERLLKLYERDTVKMEELLKVEKEIARVRIEIEQMQGRQRMWDRQIQYSTLTLNLRQKPEERPIVESEPNDVFTPIRRAYTDAVAVVLYSLSLVTTLIAWMFSFAMFVIPWVLIVLVLWFGGKKFIKR